MFCISKISGRQPVLKFKGFTLIELLVVISIIAVLMSILIPSLSRARKQAQSVVCLSNLKQMGQALQLYVQHNSNTFMPFYLENFEESLDKIMWYNFIVPDRGSTKQKTEYISDPDILFCPSYKVRPSKDLRYTDAKDYAFVIGEISYGISTGLTHDYSKPLWPVSLAKITSIKKPSQTVAVTDASHYDEKAKETTGSYFVRGYYQPFGWDVSSIRHEGSCNTLWVDGHVTKVNAPDPKKAESIYYPEALSSVLTDPTNNYWDRK